MKNNNIFYNHYLIGTIIFFFTHLTITGCYSLRETAIKDEPSINIYKIETISGDTIDFSNSKLGYATLINNEVVNIKANGEKEVFQLSKIKTYYTEKFDTGKTIWTVIGTAAILVVVFIGLFALSMDGRGFGG